MIRNIRTNSRGQGQAIGDRIERCDLARRYDQLIAEADGDLAMREFWKLGKSVFQADLGWVSRTDHPGPHGHLPTSRVEG